MTTTPTASPELPDLDRCPHCGDAAIAMHPNDLAEDGRHMSIPHSDVNYAHCDGCGAEGPQAFTHSEARDLWNRRAQPEGEAPQAAQHANLRDQIGQIIADYAAEHMNPGGEVGIDWCSASDIDPLADKIVALLDAPAAQHAEGAAPQAEPVAKYETVLLAGDHGLINDATVKQAMQDEIDAYRKRDGAAPAAQHAESGAQVGRVGTILRNIRDRVMNDQGVPVDLIDKALAGLSAQSQGAQAAPTEQEAFALAVKCGRADRFKFRIPGTSQSHKVECAVLEPSDALAFYRAALAAKAEAPALTEACALLRTARDDFGLGSELGRKVDALLDRAQQAAAPGALPERDPTKPAGQQGMFRKFDVRRTDGSDAPGGKHHGCRYYVLDLTHDQHAPAAMRAYAAACAVTHPLLAADITAEFGATPSAPGTPADRFHWSKRGMELDPNGYYVAYSAPGTPEAPSQLMQALTNGIPLKEPVSLGNALWAQREARAVLSGGTGPVAAVHLVNIGLTGWVHTKETAEAWADGYNTALKQYRSVLRVLATPQRAAQLDGGQEGSDKA